MYLLLEFANIELSDFLEKGVLGRNGTGAIRVVSSNGSAIMFLV